ncbi:Na+/H+ antiporter subunit E [Blastomonas sp.]|uniref:Na+/H+ antiporter subunit E n=1 Tax=Blastomonas sp. TaxID=1909299 RepID=UPI00262B3D34|nr:Na+/H+ antiporter subunit E [Blastomonas sp.]MDM7955791.1 Na+/H+ antiporter subunit E [Blastomonas sp.]
MKRTVALAAIWLVFAGAGLEALVVGLIFVPIAVGLSLRLVPDGIPVRLGAVAGLLPRFIAQSVIGGIDVARRAFDPRLPIDPGWIEVPVALPDGGRVALGGELSLMPGTLAAGSVGNRLLVHVLDRKQDVAAAIRHEEERLWQTTGARRGGASTGGPPKDTEGSR